VGRQDFFLSVAVFVQLSQPRTDGLVRAVVRWPWRRMQGKRMSQIPNATRLFGLQDHY
jgi:hypothetical protein